MNVKVNEPWHLLTYFLTRWSIQTNTEKAVFEIYCTYIWSGSQTLGRVIFRCVDLRGRRNTWSCFNSLCGHRTVCKGHQSTCICTCTVLENSKNLCLFLENWHTYIQGHAKMRTQTPHRSALYMYWTLTQLLHTVRPVLRDQCHDRPPAQSWQNGINFYIHTWICYQRPPVLRGHTLMANMF